MMRIAIIGGGISGLAAAYYLSRRHQVWVFEKEGRIGGHTHTVQVDSSAGPLAVDTGFIVHNDRTYPNLVRLFAELGIETQVSDMSFAASDKTNGYEYSSRGLRGFFAQKRNLFRPSQYLLLREIMRFNREAPKVLEEASGDGLGDVLERGRYSAEFAERYLSPMASAVWSMSTDAIRNFPAVTLIRFFQNHGMLGINTHPKWKVLRGGSHQYLAPLTKPFVNRIETVVQISYIARSEKSAAVHFAGDERCPILFDQVVFACHGNQVLPMLSDPSSEEQEVLGRFRTSRNDVVLHTDEGLLAKRPRARASWNYNLRDNGSTGTTVTYHMNRLQNLPGDVQYCVTRNGCDRIRPETLCAGSSTITRFMIGPRWPRRIVGKRSVGATARTFVGRTGFRVFTKMESTRHCEWQARWVCKRKNGIRALHRQFASPTVQSGGARISLRLVHGVFRHR